MTVVVSLEFQQNFVQFNYSETRVIILEIKKQRCF